jgi:hypothetical protein
MSTIDTSKDVKAFHSEEVVLSTKDQSEMRSRRDSGRTRLRNGLERDDHPLPKETAEQGSYAMRTMIEDDDCDYDIDDGVYFEKEDLKHSDGEYLTPKEARERVRWALEDDRLKHYAQVKTNCVRQRYPEGYHIDIPVYRIVRSTDIWGKEEIHYELASGDSWVKADARAVTKWFRDVVGEELKRGEADISQTRRVTRLTKKLARSRGSWKSSTTSGICITKLVVEKMVCVTDREDDALRETWKAIKKRLDLSLQIEHPTEAGRLLAAADNEEVAFFRDCLADALKKLEVLDDANCSREKALKAWDSVFNTDFFGKRDVAKAESARGLLRAAAVAPAVVPALAFPNTPVIPNKPAGFA